MNRLRYAWLWLRWWFHTAPHPNLVLYAEELERRRG